ncbi:hypothetical protein AAVH_14316 [Aphelenchoides avenae]|nr:hypothetical protein AAVH_14316 [Aphelenchus avenae]
MPFGDVLIDIGWVLERGDLESILHVDRARGDVIASAFDGKGPLRVVTKASLARGDFRCSSFEDERVLECAAGLLPYLRNAYIKTFEIDCSELDAETIRSLLGLAGYFVIDSLQLGGNAFDLINGALDCRALTWLSRFYTHGGSEVEQDYGDYENYDENVIKKLEGRFAFLEEFFKRRTVSNAQIIHLVEM